MDIVLYDVRYPEYDSTRSLTYCRHTKPLVPFSHPSAVNHSTIKLAHSKFRTAR